ncbi:PAS domain-containing protein [Skermanella sp. TT6]|uniref:PAS domain-containing protein n=1 Tax=Skermanella cutis TaxID=2775420 RepID=A0ABX7B5K4_9PROT|nr:PAS domain-containing protein [Skermanella sp. TT6]QQP89639.1 PAS domain-containing protein [Skermanella sp. TT6]
MTSNPRLPAFPAEKLRALYALWSSRLDGQALPLRSSFRPEEFQPWMGNLLIVGVEGCPRRFRLRLVGTEIVYYDGADYTGRFLDEVLKPPVARVVLRQFEDCAVRGKAMAFRYRSASFRGVEAGIDKLFLPFTQDGRTVSQIFACLYASFADPHARERPTIQDYELDGSTVAFEPAEL